MRAPSQRLQGLLEPVVAALGYELLGIDFRSRSGSVLVRLYIDRPGGVTIDDCEKVSHQVSGVLDVEDAVPGAYTLEVSSPGMDRPLFSAAQFQRFVGSEVKLKLAVPVNGQRNFRGTIREVRGEDVVINSSGTELSLAMDQIERANLVPEYEAAKKQ